MRVLMLALAVVASCRTAEAQNADLQYRPTLLVQVGVASLDRSIEFYTKTLGFKMTERRDDLRFAHIETNVPGLQIGLNQVEKPAASSAILNIGVADVAEARKTLEARGVVFTGPTRVIPGKVSLAGFRDPDGHPLSLAGPAPR